MRLVHYNIGKEINFDKNKKQLLIIENSKEFYNMVNDLILQTNGEAGEFVLGDGASLLSIEKEIFIMHNFFEFDLNSKKIENAINNQILTLINSNDYFEILGEINEKFIELNEKIKNELDYDVSYDEDLGAEKLIKLAKFKINLENELLNKIISYLEISLNLKRFRVIIFVGLSNVLSESDLNQLLKQLEYLDLNVLLIETYKKYAYLDFEKTIIDEDLCVI